MIHAFDLYSHFVHVFMFMFNFMYMSILSKLLVIHIHPLSHLPSCIYFCGLVYFWICMYTLVCTRHTYTLKDSSFDDFHVLRNFILSLIAYFHDDVFHITLIHSLYLMFSHDFVFMSMICAL